MDILIIKPEWGEKVLTGEKTWEIRGSSTSKRGTIAIAYSHTNRKFGEVELVDSVELNKEMWENNLDKHCAEGMSWDDLLKRYKKPYAWVLRNPKLYADPVQFEPHRGAVIWVKE